MGQQEAGRAGGLRGAARHTGTVTGSPTTSQPAEKRERKEAGLRSFFARCNQRNSEKFTQLGQFQHIAVMKASSPHRTLNNNGDYSLQVVDGTWSPYLVSAQSGLEGRQWEGAG